MAATTKRQRHERFLSTIGNETWKRLVAEYFKHGCANMTDEQVAELVALRVRHMKIDRRIAAECRRINRQNGVAA